jgi:superfamily II DNA or RNA helicase
VITGDAVAHYQRHSLGKPAIAFTVTTAHATHVVEQFKSAGIRSAVLTGATPDKERHRMIRDLGNGSLQVLASCNVVSEGTDIPAVATAILLRPTASYSLAMQQIGRALRIYDGKTRAVILDHSDNVRRHGLPTDAVEWSLDSVKRKKGKADSPVKQCPACAALMAVAAKVCGACGTVFPAPDAGVAADADGGRVRDGELVELTPEMMAEIRQRKRRELVSARTKEQLIALGEERHYKNPVFWAGKILEGREQWGRA